MNNWTGIGNLVKEPEVRTTTDGTSICRFTVAINDGYGDKQKTSYIPIVVFGKTAENCGKYLDKGRKVAVQGKIQTGSYEKQDGTKVYTTEIVAFSVEFLNNGETTNNAEKTSQNGNMGATEPSQMGFSALKDDDSEIPF